MQHADVSDARFGRLEEPLLKTFLSRIAAGTGSVMVLTTSRVPLTDLVSHQTAGFAPIEIGGLDRAAAVHLLRQRGVQGDDDSLSALAESYGSHALTLDHLGGVIGQFLDGDPGRAPELPVEADATDAQGAAWDDSCGATSALTYRRSRLSFSSRICLLRRCVSEEHVIQMLLCSPAVSPRMARELVDAIVQCLEAEGDEG